MKLGLRFAAPYRVWHARLRARLEAEGHDVASHPAAARLRASDVDMVSIRDTFQVVRDPLSWLEQVRKSGRSSSWTLALALMVERIVYGSRSRLFAVEAEPLRAPDQIADCVINLDGAPTSGPGLTLLFDARPGEAAMLQAMLAGRAPEITIIDDAGRLRASGLPGMERPELLSSSLDHVLAAVVDLVVTAVRSETGAAASKPIGDATHSFRPLAFATSRLAAKVTRSIRRRQRSDNRWRVATRLIGSADAGVAATGVWPKAAFTIIEDDGIDYYADPFPFEHEGRRFVFVERYLQARRKGVIAMFEIDRDGVASEPRIVLDGPGHLSYPVVFEAEGGIYMLPETSDAGCLQLFRAEPFPDRWLPDRILVGDVVVSDATPIFHEGNYWIFASLSGDGGSSWDRLGLFNAPSMLGPWTAHRSNPVLVDAGAARPGGAMWHEDGTLMRVAQDCRTGYGVGLRICRVDRLDRDGYAQTIVATLAAPEGASAVHTINRSRTIEVIDIGRPR